MKKLDLKKFMLLGASSGSLLASGCFAAPASNMNNPPNINDPTNPSTQYDDTKNSNGAPAKKDTPSSVSAAPFRSNRPFANLSDQKKKQKDQIALEDAIQQDNSSGNQPVAPAPAASKPMMQQGMKMPKGASCNSTSSCSNKPNGNSGGNSSNNAPDQNPKANDQLAFWGWGSDEKEKPTENGKENGKKTDLKQPNGKTDMDKTKSSNDQLSMEDEATPKAAPVKPQVNNKQDNSGNNNDGNNMMRGYASCRMQQGYRGESSCRSQGGCRSQNMRPEYRRPMHSGDYYYQDNMPQQSCQGPNGCKGF